MNFERFSDKHFKLFVYLGLSMLLSLVMLILPVTYINVIFSICLLVLFFIICVKYEYEIVLLILVFFVNFGALKLNFKLVEFSLSTCFNTIFVLVFAFKIVLKRNKLFSAREWTLLSLGLLSILYFFINFNIKNVNYASGYFLLILHFIVFIISDKKPSTKNIMLSLCFGVIISSLLAVFMGLIINGNLKSVLFENYRFIGLCGENPNALQIHCSFALALLILAYLKEGINKHTFYGLFLLISCCGFATMSKAFLIVFVILFIVLVLFKLCNYYNYGDRESFHEVIAIFVCTLFCCILFEDLIVKLIMRFFDTNDGDFLNSLLTGRLSLWEKYLKAWSLNLQTIFFGCGVTSNYPISMGPHNNYIDILYKFGILGTVLILINLVLGIVIKSQKCKVKKNLINWIPMIILSCLCLEEVVCNSSRAIFFVLAFITIFDKTDKTKVGSVYNEKIRSSKIFM